MDKCSHMCNNRTGHGYCKTTVCINPKYNPITIAKEYAPKFDKPVVDIVEVVRCRDCKHYHTGMYCEKWADLHPHAEEYPMVGSNGYCHYGERRGND